LPRPVSSGARFDWEFHWGFDKSFNRESFSVEPWRKDGNEGPAQLPN
jgi:hypothetical protein